MPQPRRAPRRPRRRGTLHYGKPPMVPDDLVDRLAGGGLAIPDRGRALRYLRHIGYDRLSPYTIPFQQGGPEHLLRDGTSFDDVLDLYVFDRALCLVVMDALERVEVAVRAALTDHMSTAYSALRPLPRNYPVSWSKWGATTDTGTARSVTKPRTSVIGGAGLVSSR